MMNQLIMPLAFPGPQVDADEAFAVQVATGTVAAVVVACGRFNGQVDAAQFFVHAHLGPDASVAGMFGGTVEPCIVAEFALEGNGVEDPEALAGADVIGANVAFV